MFKERRKQDKRDGVGNPMDPAISGEELYSFFNKERTAFSIKYVEDALNNRNRFARKSMPREEWLKFEKASKEYFDYKLRERQLLVKEAGEQFELTKKAFPATLLLPTYLMEEVHDLNTKGYFENVKIFEPLYLYQEQMFNFYPRQWTVRRRFEPAIMEVFRSFKEKRRLKEQNQEGAAQE